MKNLVLTFSFLLFLIVNMQGQEYGFEWQNCIGYNPIGVEGKAICQEDTSYLIAVAISDSVDLPNAHDSTEIGLFKTDLWGNIIWGKCLGGSLAEMPEKILPLTDGNFLLLGATNSTDGDIQSGNNGNMDIWIVKFDTNGEILWETTFGSTDVDIPNDVIEMPDGGFLIMATIKAGGGDVSQFHNYKDIWLCRVNNTGEILWEKSMGNDYKDLGGSFYLNSKGGITMTATAMRHGGMVECYPDQFYGDVWLVEMDLEGNILWQQCFGGSRLDVGFQSIEMDNGYIILAQTQSDNGDVTGFHNYYHEYKKDIWIFRIDDDANILWRRCLGGNEDEIPATMAKIPGADSLFVFGNIFSDGGIINNYHPDQQGTHSDIWKVILDMENGDLISNWCLGSTLSEYCGPNSLIPLGPDHFVMLGTTRSPASNDIECIQNTHIPDAWLFEYNKCPGFHPGIPGEPEGADSICSTLDMQTKYIIQPPANAWTFDWKIEPEEAGVITGYGLYAWVSWDTTFTGNANIFAKAINECEESQWSEPHTTYVFNCTGINEYAGRYALQVYPNPARDYVIFSVVDGRHRARPVPAVKITNLYGQEIASLPLTQNQTKWNVTHLPKGIYFYQLQINGNFISGKIVLQ